MPKLSVTTETFTPEGSKEAVTYSRVVVVSEKNPTIRAEIKIEKNEISLVQAIIALDGVK